MKLFYLIILLLLSTTKLSAQDKSETDGLHIVQIDSCELLDSLAHFNLIVSQRHSNPLIFANDIIIRFDTLEIDVKKIEALDVYKCPTAVRKFGFIAYNGAIVIKTKQNFESTTPAEIKKAKYQEIKENILYAVNGDIISDSSIKIAKTAIREVELLKVGQDKGYNKKFKNYSCINIWTLTKDERIPITTGCRGVKLKN